MDETTNEGTVLGGRHWKIIRTDRTLPANDVHAIRHGDDLHVSWTLFDAMQEIFGADEPDRSDPEGINKEVVEIGKMLTATTLPGDHKRFVSLVSRLIVLYGKSDPEGIGDRAHRPAKAGERNEMTDNAKPAFAGTSGAPCSVCAAMQAELKNAREYLQNAPHAELERCNVESFVKRLLKIMDKPNAGSHRQEEAGI